MPQARRLAAVTNAALSFGDATLEAVSLVAFDGYAGAANGTAVRLRAVLKAVAVFEASTGDTRCPFPTVAVVKPIARLANGPSSHRHTFLGAIAIRVVARVTYTAFGVGGAV